MLLQEKEPNPESMDNDYSPDYFNDLNEQTNINLRIPPNIENYIVEKFQNCSCDEFKQVCFDILKGYEVTETQQFTYDVVYRCHKKEAMKDILENFIYLRNRDIRNIKEQKKFYLEYTDNLKNQNSMVFKSHELFSNKVDLKKNKQSLSYTFMERLKFAINVIKGNNLEWNVSNYESRLHKDLLNKDLFEDK